jgi:hypothetical protein
MQGKGVKATVHITAQKPIYVASYGCTNLFFIKAKII